MRFFSLIPMRRPSRCRSARQTRTRLSLAADPAQGVPAFAPPLLLIAQACCGGFGDSGGLGSSGCIGALPGGGVGQALLLLLSLATAVGVHPLVGFALARRKGSRTGRALLFILAAALFPAGVAAIPGLLPVAGADLRAIPSILGMLLLPGLASVLSLLLLRRFFGSVPGALYETAEIEGAGTWRIFRETARNLPLSILAVVALALFATAWDAALFAPSPEAGAGLLHAALLLAPAALALLCARSALLRHAGEFAGFDHGVARSTRARK